MHLEILSACHFNRLSDETIPMSLLLLHWVPWPIFRFLCMWTILRPKAICARKQEKAQWRKVLPLTMLPSAACPSMPILTCLLQYVHPHLPAPVWPSSPACSRMPTLTWLTPCPPTPVCPRMPILTCLLQDAHPHIAAPYAHPHLSAPVRPSSPACPCRPILTCLLQDAPTPLPVEPKTLSTVWAWASLGSWCSALQSSTAATKRLLSWTSGLVPSRPLLACCYPYPRLALRPWFYPGLSLTTFEMRILGSLGLHTDTLKTSEREYRHYSSV